MKNVKMYNSIKTVNAELVFCTQCVKEKKRLSNAQFRSYVTTELRIR